MSASTATAQPAPDAAPPVRKERIVSLDAARAIVVALMIFMDHPMIAAALPTFLVHPEWDGFRLPDFVFPAFIFMAGVSLAFSVGKKKEFSYRDSVLPFLKRIGMLFGIGLGLNFLKYGVSKGAAGLVFHPLRFMGVLQRIALSSLIAWPFARSRRTTVLAVAAALLVAHAAVLMLVAMPGGEAGALDSKTENISAYIDRAVLGEPHTYGGRGYDPEGVLGTLSSGAQALLGLFVGQWLVAFPKDKKRLLQLLGIGVLWTVLGAALGGVIPVNKQLWTPTFVLVSSGVATMSLVTLYWIADYLGQKRWFEWLVPLGRNALLIYILSNVLLVAMRVTGVFPGAAEALSGSIPPVLATLTFQVAEVAMWFVVASWLHRRKIYFKI
ncbi:MAG: heparan-alpha-glucosaminide N-acetyltransferase domain-containing protein [Coriobacteriia bacterium]|nr:heparan-alpha-glucosaminide N-acetyltransferase domain-containing protein [Coriobacteriia bacterium]